MSKFFSCTFAGFGCDVMILLLYYLQLFLFLLLFLCFFRCCLYVFHCVCVRVCAWLCVCVLLSMGHVPDNKLIGCHDKLIHWLPDSDIIELTDEFQLANNFTVHETLSHMSMRSLIPKHFCHIMSSCIQAHAEHWNSPSTRLYFGRFLHSVSSP